MTVILTLSDLPLYFAVIVVVPVPTSVILPSSTVATDELVVVHTASEAIEVEILFLRPTRV
ncbi:hypothetical protein D3C78_1877620 [compost metagenome]